MTDSLVSLPTVPESFLFGVATAAYQIEGAATTDGRGPSIWDTYSHTPGKVVNNDNGDIACDHYNRWQSDLDLINTLNAHAYRFSIAWPRVMPSGSGKINEKGLDFYDRLIDGCLERQLQPFVTLYHWDLPQALQDKGGWANRDTANAFADYAEIVASRLGDRAASIATFNEPWCSSIVSLLHGIHAPGLKDIDRTIKSIHHQHLGHGLAVSAVRSRCDTPLGIVLNLQSIYPATESDEDKAAAKRHRDFNNGAFLDPLFNGQYPSEYVNAFTSNMPPDWQSDLATINQPLDFWGLNYYTPTRVSHDAAPGTLYPQSHYEAVAQDVTKTDIGWEIEATAFSDLLLDAYANYTLPPCYITENGACFNDDVDTNMEVNDQRRIDYLHDHIAAVNEACTQGIPVKGYFAWSLMDNFEWAEGYTMRFGLVHVNYETQKRTIKASGKWYANLIASQHT